MCARAVRSALPPHPTGTSATASDSASTRAAANVSRPPSGVAPDRARPRSQHEREHGGRHEHARGGKRTTIGPDPRDTQHRRRDQERDDGRHGVVARDRSSNGNRRACSRAAAAAPRARATERARTGREAGARARRGRRCRDPRRARRARVTGSVKSRADHALRRTADLVVEPEEHAVPTAERRDDDVDRDERPREPGGRDRRA